ncbi:NADP-dependent oxidoreductase [Pseudolysobacter antarcticus]|uniref:NADP-dependent oxidoreductase n=1 Tax=Pseudolysobacter antarcticus TaxID=2511995 RepID=A0A411HKN0_9GAMM|nr:NADP-dependent oxidoreductase [Pseudolysobacter antarcticus]QBB71075.1 NADP-dependent oxidoreductase [Pseudolysobacter antarcticus]
MGTITNRQVLLAARPSGLPKASDWQMQSVAVGSPGAGQVLVRVVYLSLDPAMRGWMNDARSYIAPVGIGEVMRAGGIGRVVESNDEKFAAGDWVGGGFGVQEYAVLNAKHLEKIDVSKLAPTVHLNVLGMPGMTAYFGLFDVGQPKAGEVVLVSGASGAVGATVGQLAKLHGCRVIGIAGGPQKCAYVKDELGFDDVIDYKSEELHVGLKRTCPQGIDVYFDNVGGDTLEAALARIRLNARIVICGAISQYNATSAVKGPANYLSLLVNRARMQGMVVFDYAARYHEGRAAMLPLLLEGKLKSREDVVTGIENFNDSLLMLFSGANNGKLVLQIADE